MALNLGGLLNLVEQASSAFQMPEPLRVETRLLRPTVASVKEFAWYAASVACPPETLKAWSCKSCKVATAVPVSDVVTFKNETSGASGYFGIDHQRKTMLVAFRGTNNVKNILYDVEFSQAPFEDAEDPEARVHSGYLGSLRSLGSYFMPPLRKALEDPRTKAYSVTLMGVSLGAAEAALAAFQVHRQLNVDWPRIAVYGFAMPRPGNVAFARLFDSKPMTAVRTVNYNDLVPHFPTAPKYAHVQHELFIDRSLPAATARFCDSSLLEDPTCGSAISPLQYDILAHFYVWDTQFLPGFTC